MLRIYSLFSSINMRMSTIKAAKLTDEQAFKIKDITDFFGINTKECRTDKDFLDKYLSFLATPR